MRTIITFLLLGIFFLGASLSYAKDVHVKGYYRKNGTYVRPHVRSAPNQNTWDNYGPSQNDNELLSPRSRDYDSDGVPNYLDRDDDNDGSSDDNDKNQYGW